MNKLNELIHMLCPEGVEYKRLGEIATVSRGGNFQKKDYVETGIPCIHYGQIYTQYRLFVDKTISFISEEKAARQKFAVKNDIIMAVTSENIDDVCKCVAWLGEEDVAVSGHTAIIHHTINPKYLVYYLHSTMFFKQKTKLAHGTKVIEVTPDKLLNIILPVPPAEIQSEIVRILDNFTQLTTELAIKLTAEITAKQKQYEYYKDQLLSFVCNVPQVKLGDYFPHIRNGFVGTATPYFTTEDNGIRYLKGTNIHDGVISDNDFCYITPEFHQKHIRNELKINDILMVQSGHVGECAVVTEQYVGANCHALIIMSNGGNCSSKYVVHYLHTTEGKKKLAAITTGGTIKHILASEMKKFTIPLPALDEQERIVDILDRLDAHCNDLVSDITAEVEARQKQYEHYRDKLLSFKEKE